MLLTDTSFWVLNMSDFTKQIFTSKALVKVIIKSPNIHLNSVLIFSMMCVHGQTELTFHQTFRKKRCSKPLSGWCLCNHRDALVHAQRHIGENKMRFLAKNLLEWSNRSKILHSNGERIVFDFHQASSNIAQQMLCD